MVPGEEGGDGFAGVGNPEAGLLEAAEGLEGGKGFEAGWDGRFKVDEAETFGGSRLGGPMGGRVEKADGLAITRLNGEGGNFWEKGFQKGPTAGAQHEGEGEGDDLAGVAVEGGGIVGEDLKTAVQEGSGEGGFAGVGGGGQDDTGIAEAAGGGVEDGEPLHFALRGRAGVGQTGDFLEKNGAGGGDERFGTDRRFATKDPIEILSAQNVECEIGGMRTDGEVG